jgi:endonuclease-8
MPEGPEVRVMTDNIRMLMGEPPILTSIRVIKDTFLKRTKGLEEIATQLPLSVTEIASKGKFTYLKLANRSCIGITYGMTGNIRTDKNIHSTVEFGYKTEAADGIFYYNSIRHFGQVLHMSEQELDKKLSELGHDILDPTALQQEEVVKIWRKRNNMNICRLLIEEQKLICGIGNYIKSEIMYHAQVHPLCDVKDLNDDTLYHLYQEARKIAMAAYTDGGASLYTYTGLEGDKSPFKLKLVVYDCKEDPNGLMVEKMETPDKRTTHWVPSVQTKGLINLSEPRTPIKLRPKPLKKL